MTVIVAATVILVMDADVNVAVAVLSAGADIPGIASGVGHTVIAVGLAVVVRVFTNLRAFVVALFAKQENRKPVRRTGYYTKVSGSRRARHLNWKSIPNNV